MPEALWPVPASGGNTDTAAHEEYLFALRGLCGESVTESSQNLYAVSFLIRRKLRSTLSGDTVHDAQGIIFVIYLADTDGTGQQSAAVLRIDADELTGILRMPPAP